MTKFPHVKRHNHTDSLLKIKNIQASVHS